MLPDLKNFNNWLIGDLHIHSRFSRACSKDLNLDNLVKWANIKGIDLLGTGDFTHPKWLEEIKTNLKDNGKGFFIHSTGFAFVLSGEVSLIYTKNGKGRKVHLVLLAPSLEVVDKINNYFDKKKLRRDYDGRPIFGIDCEVFVRDMKNISDEIEIIPAHIWTPHFGLFGSASGFDSLSEAFGEQEKNIYSIETGISSDPEMNWKINCLKDKSILSFSDSHSFWPWRLGREATIFRKTDSYSDLIKQIRGNDFIGTIEADPAYGKYHWDGHRNCDFFSQPSKTKELNGICPVCNKPMVIGVEYRVEELASNSEIPEKSKPYFKLLPLHEIISLYLGVGVNSKKVWEMYNKIIDIFETEFNFLLRVDRKEILDSGFEKSFAELVLKNRKGKIKVQPGYDGEYGKAILEEIKIEKQKSLF